LWQIGRKNSGEGEAAGRIFVGKLTHKQKNGKIVAGTRYKRKKNKKSVSIQAPSFGEG
jgi:hypothetical protein